MNINVNFAQDLRSTVNQKKKKIYKLNANKATKSVTLRIKINLT